ncbi:MAG: hypothetical protein LBT75_03540, partial [Bacilli bacterium]|nr:hypothetical protein [Bacilli bacterium]
YSNTSGKLIDDVVFQDNGIVDHRTYYNDEGIKTRTLSHYKNSNSVEWETFYKEDGFKEKANRYSNGTNKLIDEIIFQDNNKVDVRTYFSEDSKTLRKIRYFKDGDHLRWDINYENGLKKNVHLYSKNNYALLENFYYTKEILELEDEIFKQMELDDYVTVWSNVINDSTFLGYMLDEIDLDVDDLFYYEDILHIKNIVINDSSNLYHNLNHKINDFDIENLEYIEKSNNIENLSGIEYIVRLEDIVVNNSEITELPDNISNLKRLRKIVIVNGSLSELPTSITKLKDLNEVNLSGNKLSAIDNNLLNLENIKSIDFSAIAIVNIGDGILSSHVEKINISPEMLNLDKTTRENISDYINSGKLKKSNNIILNYIDTHEIEKFKLEEYDLKNDISEYINGNKTKIKAEFLKQSDNTQSKFDYSEDDFKSIDIDDISNALVEEQGIYILKLSYDIHNYTFTSIFKIIIHNEIVEEYNLLISEPEDVEDNSANTRGEFDFRCNGSKKIKTISFSKVVPHSGYMGTFKKGIGSYFFSNNRNVNVPFSISFGVNYGFFSISATANFKNSGDRDGFGLTTNKKKYSRAVWNVKGNATLYKRYGGIFCNSKYTKYKINFIEPFIQYK